ncbi:hypothetical protein CPLU01_05672 [Colletotrichum plurivorum]|uniref:Uncharacterized protein n=1 Tax=Colletotrichum plurivorum TaxID=2175906 RepID=A0A8H6KLI0_9PEZI|nr:hypothetical protein CPLU01_05672 [Colletotrichum plurivorum]
MTSPISLRDSTPSHCPPPDSATFC